MHEASIAQHVIDQLVDRIKTGALPPKIERIHLKIGKLTAVVTDNLLFMFEVLARETPLAGVEVIITDIPIGCRCTKCNAEFETTEMNFWCRACGSPEVTIITGRELIIDSIEVADEHEEN